MTNKNKVGWYISHNVLGQMNQICLQKNLSMSVLAEKYLLEGLKNEDVLSSFERTNIKITLANLSANSLLSSQNCVVTGSLGAKIEVAILLSSTFSRRKIENSAKIEYLSVLCSIIHDIIYTDSLESEEIKQILRKYPQINKMYINIYDSNQRTIEP